MQAIAETMMIVVPALALTWSALTAPELPFMHRPALNATVDRPISVFSMWTTAYTTSCVHPHGIWLSDSLCTAYIALHIVWPFADELWHSCWRSDISKSKAFDAAVTKIACDAGALTFLVRGCFLVHPGASMLACGRSLCLPILSVAPQPLILLRATRSSLLATPASSSASHAELLCLAATARVQEQHVSSCALVALQRQVPQRLCRWGGHCNARAAVPL
jgi:hypothetical protein